ncbi:MAG: phosphoesterase [Deltaproteobacteria bacterium RBG_13_65_10]|nr:MAG: phosphoesterase [Deltaproteobacteria bacterium RBG_13_65_10]
MGCANASQQRKLVNPLAGIAFDLEGTDSHQLAMPAAPAFASAEEAGEIVENYWMALLRDVPFTQYETHLLVQEAATELSALSDFRGPKVLGQVTPATLFRANLPGALAGPTISQFLLKPIPFGAQFVEQRMRTVAPDVDYLMSEGDWLEAQNGCAPSQPIQFDATRRYIRNGRDLGQWVHVDVLFQAYFDALLILLTPPDPSDTVTGGGIGAPPNPGNPYLGSKTQQGFGTFGGPYMATMVAEVATRALKAQWYQKWFVHRRLRPEAFAGAVHHALVHGRGYSIHDDVLNSGALAQVFSKYGTYFLPMAFPEGSPVHPAYGAGHATVAGACVTILKAMFDETFLVPSPVVPSADGLSLEPYTGPDAGSLTVGGELDKLAANIALGRNLAGVHWRTDGSESLLLGEAVAIGILRDQRGCYGEEFGGFTFTKFDGTQITV